MGKILSGVEALGAAVDFELCAYMGVEGSSMARASIASLMVACRQWGYVAFSRWAARNNVPLDVCQHVVRLAGYSR